MYELIVTSEWLNMRYHDFPDDRKDDVPEFISVQENVGLLSALMLTILADMLFNFADASTMRKAVLTCLIWTSTLTYFVACTWSVFNIMCITQADTDAEGKVVLACMSWRATMPVRLWVYASLLTGMTFVVYFVDVVEIESMFDLSSGPSDGNNASRWLVLMVCGGETLLVACYLIYCIAVNVQLVYSCKRDSKLSLQALTSPGATAEDKSIQNLLCHQICIPSAQMRVDLTSFAKHVGSEHVELELFLRFLFRKHRPDGLSSKELAILDFAPITRRRAERIIEDYVDEAVGVAEERPRYTSNAAISALPMV